MIRTTVENTAASALAAVFFRLHRQNLGLSVRCVGRGGTRGMRRMHRGTLLKKCPPDPPQNFLGKVLSPPKGEVHRQRWREVTPTFVDVGYRQDPAVSPPCFQGLQRCLGIKRTNTPIPTRSPLWADPSVDAKNNITTTHKRPCRQIAGMLHPNKPRRPVGGALSKFSWV